MKYILSFLIFGFSITTFYAQDPFDKQINEKFKYRSVVDTSKIYNLYSNLLPSNNSLTNDSIAKFHKLLNQLMKFDESKTKIKGSVSMGLSGQEAFYNDISNNPASQYNVSSGIQFTMGSYPGELKVNSKVDAILTNGKLATNLSNQEVSYDRYVNHYMQYYVYIGRFSNIFTSIQSRYEAGLGVVLDLRKSASSLFQKTKSIANTRSRYSASKHTAMETSLYYHLTKKGRKELESLIFDISELENKKWFENISKLSQPHKRFELAETIRDAKQDNLNGVYKSKSKIRVSLLVGLYTEIEEVRLTGEATSLDTISTIPRSIQRDYDIELTSTQTWRLMLRPSIEYRNNYLTAYARVFGKFKVFRDYLDSNLPYSSDLTDDSIIVGLMNPEDINSGFDYRVDTQIGINLKFKPITIALTYNYYYDNLAPQLVLNGQNVLGLNTPQIASARNTHGILDMKFKYTFQ